MIAMTRQSFFQVTNQPPTRLKNVSSKHNLRCSLRLQILTSLSETEQPHRVRAAVDAGRGAHLSVGSVMGGRLNTLPAPSSSAQNGDHATYSN